MRSEPVAAIAVPAKVAVWPEAAPPTQAPAAAVQEPIMKKEEVESPRTATV